MKDIMGMMVNAYALGDKTPYYIRREDDFLTGPNDVGVYFSQYLQWQDFERKILRYIAGRILDIGAGAGRHSLYCQALGHETHAIDVSPGAVSLMRENGLSNAYRMNLNDLSFEENYFDTVLMMFNNFGLAGSFEATKQLLQKLDEMTAPLATVIATVRNPYWTEDERHLQYQKRKAKEGKSGQARTRLEYKGEVGEWFDLLMLSAIELLDVMDGTDWQITEIRENREQGTYGVVLNKMSESRKWRTIKERLVQEALATKN